MRPPLLCSWLFALVPAVALSAEPGKGLTVFIQAGQPKLLLHDARGWRRADGCLEAAGTDKELWAGKALGKGDFHVRAKLTIHGLARSAAAFRIGGSYFGFEGAHGKVFLTGPLFNAHGKPIGNPADFMADGEPFLFEVVRKGRRLSFLIDGKTAHAMACTDGPLGTIGFSSISALAFPTNLHFAAAVSSAQRVWCVDCRNLSIDDKRHSVANDLGGCHVVRGDHCGDPQLLPLLDDLADTH